MWIETNGFNDLIFLFGSSTLGVIYSCYWMLLSWLRNWACRLELWYLLNVVVAWHWTTKIVDTNPISITIHVLHILCYENKKTSSMICLSFIPTYIKSVVVLTNLTHTTYLREVFVLGLMFGSSSHSPGNGTRRKTSLMKFKFVIYLPGLVGLWTLLVCTAALVA